MNDYQPPPNQGTPYANGPAVAPAAHRTPESLRQQASMRELRRLSITAGFCVLVFIGLQFAVFFALSVAGLGDDFENNVLFQTSFGAVYSVICVFLPFFLVAVLMSGKTRSETLLFGKPYSVWLMLLAVPAGFMYCMVGNYATGALITLMDSFGVTLSAPEMPVPATGLGMTMYIVQIAFIPALIEEFALRGVVMQPLRKYGDRFAIIMSSIIFALMHGNMVQAPFAFIAGIAIGYFVIATGTIWTGVLIHFANNLFSSLLTLISSNTDISMETPYAVVMTAAFVFGIACCVLFALSAERGRLGKPETPAGTVRRAVNYIFTPPMIAALAAIAYITMDYIDFGG